MQNKIENILQTYFPTSQRTRRNRHELEAELPIETHEEIKNEDMNLSFKKIVKRGRNSKINLIDKQRVLHYQYLLIKKNKEIRKCFPQEKPKNKRISVSTIDGFQGNEKDAIIYSSVATCRPYCFISDEKRLNVAFTRSTTLVINGMDTEKIPVSKGVRQGSAISPFLFNLYADDLDKATEGLTIGLLSGGKMPTKSNFQYADDTAYVAESVEQIERVLERLRT